MDKMGKVDSVVETSGVFTSTFFNGEKTNEPGEEVFAQYRLFAATDKNILPTKHGWWIYLSREQSSLLFNNRFISIVHQGSVSSYGKEYPITNQISISLMKELEDSMHCVHFPQTFSR